MIVEIPKSLISRLSGLGPHFIRVSKQGKEPIDKGWTLNPLSHDNQKLQTWLKQGGNYGVIGGFGLVIIDIDSKKLKAIAKEKLPKTFTIQSPGSKGLHLYCISSIEKPIRLRSEEGENLGDIQGQGKMVVGPDSVHPNGERYEIIEDISFAQVTRDQLMEAFKDYVIPEQEISHIEKTAEIERKETKIDVAIAQIVPLGGLERRGTEYFGAHPVHGSKTGQNFWVNTSKNCWHCFRCQSGGGPLLFLAVQERIISCADAGPGALRGHIFNKVLEKAVELGIVEKSKVNIKQGFLLGFFWLEKKGSKAFLYDKDGEPRVSSNINAVDGLHFKKKLHEITSRPESEVDRVTAKFQLSIQEKGFSIQDESDEETLPPEVVERAEALLRDPFLLCKIADGVHALGLVGETRNSLLTFLTMISSRLKDPINLRWSSRASIGKSTIVVKTSELFPPEDIFIKTGLTRKSVFYMHETEFVDPQTRRLILQGKIFILLEESGSQEFLDEIKPLLSHDKNVLEYDFVEERVTCTVRLEGFPSYIGITTVPIKGEEHETRTMLATPDRGKRKYSAVIISDAEIHAFPWETRNCDTRVYHEVVRRLEPVEIAIPWLPIVAKYFPKGKAPSMRDWKKLRTYIEAVAFLHQKQRPKFRRGEQEYVVALPIDLEIAVKIVEGAMAETILGLSNDVREFNDFLREKTKDVFTYKELMTLYHECFGESVSKTTLRDRYIAKLEDIGFVEIDSSKKPYKISILAKTSASLADFQKAINEIRSEETKAEMMRKVSAKLEGEQKEFFQSFENYYSLSLSNFADLEKLLGRSKQEEYLVEETFVESAEDADFSQKKEQKSKKTKSMKFGDLEIPVETEESIKKKTMQETIEYMKEHLTKPVFSFEDVTKACRKAGGTNLYCASLIATLEHDGLLLKLPEGVYQLVR